MEGVTTQNGNGKQKVAALLSVLAFAFIAACIGGDEWLRYNYWSQYGSNIPYSRSVKTGLWRRCVDTSDMGISESYCEAIDDQGSALQAVRVFIVIGTISSIVNMGLAIMVLNRENTKARTASFFQFATAAFVIIGLIIYLAEIGREEGFYGWTFFVGWVGGIFAAIGGAVGTCGRTERRL